MFAIHHHNQGFSECFNRRWSRVGLGEMNARCGSYAIAIVAIPAARLFEHWIKSSGECRVLGVAGGS
jgi:hypothetical protein